MDMDVWILTMRCSVAQAWGLNDVAKAQKYPMLSLTEWATDPLAQLSWLAIRNWSSSKHSLLKSFFGGINQLARSARPGHTSSQVLDWPEWAVLVAARKLAS